MNSSGFQADAAYSIFEELRPGPSLSLDKISVVTYSLDLVAVAALVLSLGAGGEEELRAGALEFADAIRNLKPKLTIIHQKGRLRLPTRYNDILHLLDGSVRAVRPTRRASWHPKAILARYRGPRDTTSWRLWLGSRNLTGSHDREAGLLLIGSPGPRERPAGVSSTLREVFADADWTTEDFEDLDRVRWVAPEGVKLRSLRWRPQGRDLLLVDPLKDAHSLLAISPFVDAAGLSRLQDVPARRLLTSERAAADLGATPGLDVRVMGAPTFDEPVEPDDTGEDGAPSAFQPSGLHAKLILLRSNSINRLWIGSANATGRGLAGPNAELVAELDVNAAHADSLEVFWASAVEPSEAPVVDAEAKALEAAERRLDEALCDLLAVGFVLKVTSEGLSLSASSSFEAFLRGHRLWVSLLTLPDDEVEWSSGSSVVVAPRDTPLRLQTVLVGFRVEALTPPHARRTWAQAVDFPGLDPVARDCAALANYIGAARFAAWLRSQLEGIEAIGPSNETWTGAPRGAALAVGLGLASRPFTLENVLAAWARDPADFEMRVAQIDKVVRAFVEELRGFDPEEAAAAREMLAAFMPFWEELLESLSVTHGA